MPERKATPLKTGSHWNSYGNIVGCPFGLPAAQVIDQTVIRLYSARGQLRRPIIFARPHLEPPPYGKNVTVRLSRRTMKVTTP